MKVIVSFSGGKDSLASLLWVRNNLTKDFITVFCDTGWEHPLTYKYIEEVQEQLGLNLITVKSKKFNGMVDLTKKKSRWPSSQRRFCTSELKTIPMIDYILDEVNDDVLIIQGIGEVVAIAQSYMDVDRFHRKGKNAAYLEYLDSILPELKLHPGWTNKMFVKADLMPRHIEFTDRKVERLQDISDEDCLKEGIYEDSGDDEFPPSIFYEFEGNKDNGFDTPREAFAALIDKVSGKGTWESNPYVWAYEFELMK